MSKWMSQNRHLYPHNWADIATRVKQAAVWKCRICGTPHAPRRVLTVHHLDHNPRNCTDENLLACCQSCHLKFQHIQPYPANCSEAIERWRELLATAESQQTLFGEVPA
jgi:5-methylcytosine-specific restriction endonuclease McrA